jgi:hypothetical protein
MVSSQGVGFAAMDYRKGFQRLYAVLAICWIGVGLAFGIGFSLDPRETVTESGLFGWLAATALPPLLVYILGFIAIPWIASGFKSKDSSPH